MINNSIIIALILFLSCGRSYNNGNKVEIASIPILQYCNQSLGKKILMANCNEIPTLSNRKIESNECPTVCFDITNDSLIHSINEYDMSVEDYKKYLVSFESSLGEPIIENKSDRQTIYWMLSKDQILIELYKINKDSNYVYGLSFQDYKLISN